MKVERQSPILWRRHGTLGVTVALGLVAVIFLSNCSGAPQTPAPTPAPLPAIVQPTAAPTAANTNKPAGGNDSAPGLARVTGSFTSGTQAALAFQTPGRIKQYMVKEGDKVKQGDTLATLDTSILEFQVEQAQAALSLAKARLQQTQAPVTQEQSDAAQAALKAAQEAYTRVSKGPLPDEIAAAKAGVERAKAVLDQAQAAYDKAGGASNPYSGLLPTSVNLQQATAGYDAAVAAYNLAKNHPTASELAGAAAQLAQAKAAIAQLVPTTENLAIAQAGVDQAQAAVDLAKASLNNATLTAPFDGTVVLTGPKVGEYANPGVPIVTLADLGKMQVIANVDELTLAGLKVGLPATLYLDALGGQSLTGKISKIGLFATNAGGVTSVPVTIDVDPTNAAIYPGLSATVQFQQAP